MSVMRLRRASIAAVARSMASSAARSSAWASPLLRALESAMRSAASSWRVSSCSSRAQRTRSRSEASTLRRSPWAATFCAVMTAVAADAAKACTRRWSSALNSGPATVRSKAASTPTASPRKTSGTIRPVAAPTCSASAKRSRDGASARRSGCWRAQDVARHRPLHGDPPAHDVGRHLARGGLHHELLAVAQRDEHRARVDEGAAALDQQLEDALEVGLAADRPRDRRRRLERRDGPLELVAARGDAAVQARVLDRDRRPVGEHDERLLVGLVEVAVRLLGQIEVAVGLAADEDRHAQEAVHRRDGRAESRTSADARPRRAAAVGAGR